MTENEPVYIERNPGDLITAEDWNALQRQIREDIETTSTEAAHGVTHVASANDAHQIDGKDLAALTDEITRRVLESVRAESGYRKVFKILQSKHKRNIIEHNLGDCPLVDVYKLQYFFVACAEDDDIRRTITTFYLHHCSEEQIRVTDENKERHVIDIRYDKSRSVGIPFTEMLARYDVPYTETTSLGDLENEFWKAFFSEPNDKFDGEQYCHSPWFERCCREERDVASLRAKGDLDDLIFQVRPWKIESGPVQAVGDADNPIKVTGPSVPANVAVEHLDLNRVALSLKDEAIHIGDAEKRIGPGATPSDFVFPEEFENELKVMVLLRV